MFSSEDKANFEELVGHLSKRLNTSILVGAGISVTSGVPTSARIIRILRRLRLVDGHPDYAVAMEKAFKTNHQRRAFLERLFLGKPPSREHYSLAHLVKDHVFETIFTTNFDHLAEIALSQVCTDSVHSYLTRTGLESIDKRTGAALVVKLHGDFLFSSLANTDEEMGHAITDSMRLKFSTLLKEGSLVVLGYAGDGSILEMLQELAATPKILSHGVWWILHCRPESDSVPEAPQHVVKFLSTIRGNGKRAILIRNSLGAQWFLDSLCQRVTGEAPLKPTFGIGTTQDLAPRVIWTPTPQLTRSTTTTPQKLSEALQEAASSSSLIFVRGSTAADKTNLITRFVSESRARPCFYFSFAFARNNPEDYSFLTALGAFLDDQNLLDEDPNKRFWVENLFDHNGIIVLDDLPVSLDKTRRDVRVGACRASFPKVLYPALAVLQKLSKGNVILCLPESAAEAWLDYLSNVKSMAPEVKVTEISLPESPNEIPTASALLRSLGRAERRILPAMATLRFAESADFIASIAKVHDSVLASLHHLVELGVVKEYGARFLIRIPYRVKLLRHIYNTWPTQKLIDLMVNVARTYEKAADDPESPASRHCLLEAENAYFEAGIGFGAHTWTDGMKALVQISLELAESPLSKEFIFATVKSYFNAFGDGIFLGLDLRDLSTLFSAFGVTTASKGNGFGTVIDSFLKALRRRNELLPAWLMAQSIAERDNDVSPEGSSKILMIKEELRAKKRQKALSADDWVLLGRSYLALNRCYSVLYSATQRKDILGHSKRYARLAHGCFRRVRDEIGERDSLRYLGLTYMLGGNYRLARKTLVPLFRKEIAEAGFDPFKAASLNNLYCVYLGVGAVRLAEGYFWEANYQYAYSGRAKSVISLLTLALAPLAEPGRRVFERHPGLRNAIPPLGVLLDKLMYAWNRSGLEDKRDSFFRLSEALMIVSASFEEAHDVSKELQALTFVVKVHEDCFAEPEPDGGQTRLPQKLILESLRRHLLRCIAGARLDPRNIQSVFSPIRTRPMKDMLQNLVSESAQNGVAT